MGLIDGWEAQNLYNEFLELKIEIPQLIKSREHFSEINKQKEVQELQHSIDQQVVRIRFILNELKTVHDVKMEDLILLSAGIELE